jgi:hypothetical protein
LYLVIRIAFVPDASLRNRCLVDNRPPSSGTEISHPLLLRLRCIDLLLLHVFVQTLLHMSCNEASTLLDMLNTLQSSVSEKGTRMRMRTYQEIKTIIDLQLVCDIRPYCLESLPAEIKALVGGHSEIEWVIRSIQGHIYRIQVCFLPRVQPGREGFDSDIALGHESGGRWRNWV